MIQIGNRIWITENLNKADSGGLPTVDCLVHLDGKPVPGVNHIFMDFNAHLAHTKKHCAVYAFDNNAEQAEEFAAELAQHGFYVNVTYAKMTDPMRNGLVVEYSLRDGKVIREECALWRPSKIG